MPLKNKSLGLYIHTPFCVHKCPYCAFYSEVIDDQKIYEKYFDAVLREAVSYNGYTIDTLYFGGGTPSILPVGILGRFLEKVSLIFAFSLKEMTIEINPIHFSEKYIKELKKLGFNRFSLGIQSFNNKKLKLLGRLHNTDDIERIMKARSLLDNFSIDLMFGFKDDFKLIESEFKMIKELSPTHLSIYNLKIEKGTSFYELKKRNKLPLVGEDMEAVLFEKISKSSEKLGYEHYEVSNFALKGYKSLHNLKYWHFDEYIGLGASASGYIDNLLYKNNCSIADYLNGKYNREIEKLGDKDKRYYQLIMGLRLKEGVLLREDELEHDFSEIKEFIEIKEKRLKIKKKHFFILNEIILKIIDILGF